MKKRFENLKISRAVTPLLGRQHGFLYLPICEKVRLWSSCVYVVIGFACAIRYFAMK